MPTRKKSTPTIFGKRLRYLRHRRKLAQFELGVLAGLEESSSSTRISRYETGFTEPTFQFAEALAGVLDVSPAFFFCPDDELAELILIFSKLSGRNREILSQTAKNLRDAQ
jgi:transcriptional regulator with XRE-family HTH domain